MTVVDFDTEVRTARFSQAEFAQLDRADPSAENHGHDGAYDAIGVYLDGAARQEGRKIMVRTPTAGIPGALMRLSELLDSAQGVRRHRLRRRGDPRIRVRSSRDQARTVLNTIAETTGGQAFYPTSTKDLDLMTRRWWVKSEPSITIGYVSTQRPG